MAKQVAGIEQVRHAAAEYAEGTFQYPNVIGYGVGQKTTMGRKTGEPCLVVFVERKLPISSLRVHEVISCHFPAPQSPSRTRLMTSLN
jgi:hypothetical protein